MCATSSTKWVLLVELCKRFQAVLSCVRFGSSLKVINKIPISISIFSQTGLPKLFARGNLLASNNNHGSAHSCSHNCSVRMTFFQARQLLVGQDLLSIEASPSHSDTPQPVGFHRKNDRRDAETSTWQHTTITRDRLPWLRQDSNSQSQQASSRKPAP